VAHEDSDVAELLFMILDTFFFLAVVEIWLLLSTIVLRRLRNPIRP